MKYKCLVFAFILILTALSGCKVKEYIPIEKVVTEVKYEHLVDTIIQYDSVFINQYTKNDTVYKEKETVRYKYNTVIKDSISIKTDSIPVIVEVEKVKKVHYHYEKYLWASLVILILLIIYKIKKLIL